MSCCVYVCWTSGSPSCPWSIPIARATSRVKAEARRKLVVTVVDMSFVSFWFSSLPVKEWVWFKLKLETHYGLVLAPSLLLDIGHCRHQLNDVVGHPHKASLSPIRGVSHRASVLSLHDLSGLALHIACKRETKTNPHRRIGNVVFGMLVYWNVS
jgi:hypothetical protein